MWCRKIVAHAHWTLNNQKMAKSRGNVVDPIEKYASMQSYLSTFFFSFFSYKENKTKKEKEKIQATRSSAPLPVYLVASYSHALAHSPTVTQSHRHTHSMWGSCAPAVPPSSPARGTLTVSNFRMDMYGVDQLRFFLLRDGT